MDDDVSLWSNIMDMESFQYKADSGWTVSKFPDLDSDKTIILIFAAPQFLENPAPIKELAQYYPNSKIIGCSGAGEIYGPHIFDHSLSVCIIKFDQTPLRVTKTEIESDGSSFEAGLKISQELMADDLSAIFVLSEGLKVNGSEMVQGVNQYIGDKTNIVITGGLAGDGKDFQQTWVIYNGEIYKNSIVALGLYGKNIKIGHASRGGWDIFGPERIITRSKHNVLYELDGKPALELYKEYLGDRAAGLPATGLLYPLAIRENAQDEKQLVRTILSVNEEDQSLTFAGDIPTGYLAKLMRANFDRLISSASEAGDIAIHQVLKTKAPIVNIAISCVGRRLLLGERTDEETEAIFEKLPQESIQVGFYSYGELSPYTSGKCDLHNQTMTLTTFSEEKNGVT